jgi:hypothetical protein
MRTLGMAAARAATSEPASSIGASPGTGAGEFSTKWSAIQTPSHPVTSAWRAVATTSAQG